MSKKALIALAAGALVAFSIAGSALAVVLQKQACRQAMEAVFRADAECAELARKGTPTGKVNIKDFCERIARVPVDRCPADFQQAWRAYCLAWSAIDHGPTADNSKLIFGILQSLAISNPLPLAATAWSESSRVKSQKELASAQLEDTRRAVMLTAARYGVKAPESF